MRLTFKKIEIYNFRSFDLETFEFEKFNGLNLVCGKNNDLSGAKNGSGKTNLISALVFSLFGTTLNNARNSHIANMFSTTKEVRVSTWFFVDKLEYKITSGFNKYGNQYCELLKIDKDIETNLTKSTMSETRKFVETELIHCDLPIFMRTILLSSDQNYNFFMLKKNDKKEFVEKLFDISIFGDMYAKIHKDVLKYDKSIEIDQNKIIQLNRNLDIYIEKIKAFEDQQKSQLSKLQKQLDELQKQKKTLASKHLVDNSTEIDKTKVAIDKLNQVLNTLVCKENELISKNTNLKIQLKNLEGIRDQKTKLISKHSDLMNQLCNDCKKIFSDYYSIEILTNEVNALSILISNLTEELTLRESNIDKIKTKKTECQNKISSLNINLDKLTEQTLKVSIQLSKIDSDVSSIENSIAKINNSENPYSDLKDTCEIDIQETLKTLDSKIEQHKYLSFAENIVSQDTLRKFIISDLITLLNSKIKMYLSKFGSKYNVIFDEDMNYKLLIGSKEFDYCDFSGGERSRLMIAACFAFRDFMYIRNNFSSNILFLDEFIDGAIDSLAMENILEILSDYCQQYDQNIFIVSHRKSEMDNTIFNHIIQVVKTNNISKINYLE